MWGLLVVMLIAAPTLACDKGCTEYNGSCACDEKPEQALQTYVPSDEKPPKNQQAEWQTGAVHADFFPSQTQGDAEHDQAIKQADAEGKRAAGIQ